jgi:hypothetical protein
MAVSKLLQAAVLSTSLALSPLMAQSAFAQTAPAPTTGSTTGAAGGQAAKDAAKGGLSDEAIVGIVVVVGAGIAVAASSGGGSSGATGTTGTTTPR